MVKIKITTVEEMKELVSIPGTYGWFRYIDSERISLIYENSLMQNALDRYEQEPDIFKGLYAISYMSSHAAIEWIRTHGEDNKG